MVRLGGLGPRGRALTLALTLTPILPLPYPYPTPTLPLPYPYPTPNNFAKDAASEADMRAMGLNVPHAYCVLALTEVEG